jgi:hypothetical protein
MVHLPRIAEDFRGIGVVGFVTRPPPWVTLPTMAFPVSPAKPS